MSSIIANLKPKSKFKKPDSADFLPSRVFDVI